VVPCSFCGVGAGFVAVVEFYTGGLGRGYAAFGVGSVCSLIIWLM
jgi:hypothetical protein